MTDIDHYENAVNDLFRAAATSKKLDHSALVEAILAAVVELRRIADQQWKHSPEAMEAGLADAARDVVDLRHRVARIESLHADPEWCVALTPEEERDLDTPRVCVTHQRFVPCRHGSDESPCEYSDDPQDVERVRDFQRDGHNAAGEAVKAPQSDEQGDGVAGDSHEARPGESDSAGEPLTEEPPVGTQVVDGFGNLWENLTDGWTRWEFRGWAFGRHVGAGRAWSSMAAPLRLATDADRERVDLPRDQWPSRPPKPNTDFLLGSIPPRTPGECDDCGSRTLGPDEIAVKVPKCADVSDWLLAIADALEAQEGR